jgi:hypothetical protein
VKLWAAAAALNDAVTEYHRLHRQLFGVARSVGITEDAWFAIKRGSWVDRRPRPGLAAFQSSTVWGSHPLTVPIRASGSGKRYRLSVSGRTPMRWANSALLAYRTVTCAPYEERWRPDSYA